MARTIWVKPAHPKAQFYQEAQDEKTGEIVTEHVRAETVDGRQVPMCVQITHTAAVAHALMEMIPGSQPKVPAIIIECTQEEVTKQIGTPLTSAVTITAATPQTSVTTPAATADVPGTPAGPTETAAAQKAGTQTGGKA